MVLMMPTTVTAKLVVKVVIVSMATAHRLWRRLYRMTSSGKIV